MGDPGSSKSNSTTHNSLPGLAPPLLPPVSLNSLNTSTAANSQLVHCDRRPFPSSLPFHLLQAPRGPPRTSRSATADDQEHNRPTWRRRGEPPHERAMSVRRACVRHASDACIHLGELGAGRLLAAQLTRVGGARVRLICTAACALCCFTLSSPADCELVVACRVRCCGGTEFRSFMSCFMYVVGHLNDTIDCVYGRDSLRAIRIAGKSD